MQHFDISRKLACECPAMKVCLNWLAEMLSVRPELRLLLLLSCITLVLLFQVTDAKRDLKSACSTCKQITDNFNKVTASLNISFPFVFRFIYYICVCFLLPQVLPNAWNGFKFYKTLAPFFLYKLTMFFLFFRALTEQQSRTLAEATQPGRRENCLNMRRGEMVQPVQSKL